MIQMKVKEMENPIQMTVNEGIGQIYVKGDASYASLPDKPTLNGRTLVGKMELSDIGIRAIPLAEIEKMFKDW